MTAGLETRKSRGEGEKAPGRTNPACSACERKARERERGLPTNWGICFTLSCTQRVHRTPVRAAVVTRMFLNMCVLIVTGIPIEAPNKDHQKGKTSYYPETSATDTFLYISAGDFLCGRRMREVGANRRRTTLRLCARNRGCYAPATQWFYLSRTE